MMLGYLRGACLALRLPALCVVIGACVFAFASANAADSTAAAVGLVQHDVQFAQYTPLAGNRELARRLLSPLRYEAFSALAARVREHPLDLANERFIVRLPKSPPPERGYGLLVFIPPWPEAALPAAWVSALDRYGIAYVSAASSGNDADVPSRRIPLAMLAYANMRSRYAFDPQRIYIGGFSGGARVALRVALAYADVFRGALLDAGGDPIGTGEIPLPPPDLLQLFQDATRIVYVTGEHDEGNVHAALISRRSLTDTCVFDSDTETLPRLGHEAPDASGFARALKLLERRDVPDPARLTACRAKLDTDAAAALAEAEAALRAGERTRASSLLQAADARYGSLIARGVVDLQKRIDAR